MENLKIDLMEKNYDWHIIFACVFCVLLFLAGCGDDEKEVRVEQNPMGQTLYEERQGWFRVMNNKMTCSGRIGQTWVQCFWNY